MAHARAIRTGILSLAVFLTACAGPASTPLKTKSQAANVTDFLASVRERGAALGCNPAEVDASLGTRLALTKARHWEREGIYEENYQLLPLANSLLSGNGEYRRFRSATTSSCQIIMTIPAGALCDIHSDQYRAKVGAYAVPHFPIHPSRDPRPDSQAFHLFGATDAKHRDEVWLSSRYGEKCAYQVIVRTYGPFQAMP